MTIYEGIVVAYDENGIALDFFFLQDGSLYSRNAPLPDCPSDLKYFGSTSASFLPHRVHVVEETFAITHTRTWQGRPHFLKKACLSLFKGKIFQTCFGEGCKPLEDSYLLETMKSEEGKKIQLLKCTYTAGRHCCDSQRYERQSIIGTNASCANEHSQKSADFSGKEKRSVSLLAELIQGTKVKAPRSLPLLLLLLSRLLMCAEERGLCLGLSISSSLPAINIHIHMKSAGSH